MDKKILNHDGKFTVHLYVSGKKTAGSEVTSSRPYISFKLYDSTNAVIKSGTIMGPAIVKGESFVDASDFVSTSLQPGSYRIEILNTR